MDAEEVQRRGPGIVLGCFTLMVGGMLALLGIMYDPVDTGTPVGGPLFPDGVLPTPDQSSGSPGLFAAMAVTGVVLGGWSAYLFRGARAMVLVSGLVGVVCAYNLYGLLGSA